ncbi:glutathione S-transferase C-terminal domain-containing protein isoform X2 [Ambystoma mexicanum]|uniref:glutathione S-transferase C-terminal domain-containing protein isoform X2 n=1 Tax=Ambystoma mexicanum TaxID=8296 RepID=UPI0037E8F877
MKNSGASVVEECLYLDLAHQQEGCIFPLHTSIALFLVAYCGSKTLKVFLVPSIKSDEGQESRVQLSKNMEVDIISREEIPLVAQNCRLPAIVEKDSMFCRAGLAAVLRHIVKKASAEDPSKKDVSELLGFKNTCLKACAEVSQWTRLCEISIPLAVESFLKESSMIPLEIEKLEKKLGEPVRVHNDDKIRRQKLQQQVEGGTARGFDLTQGKTSNLRQEDEERGDSHEPTNANLELRAALSKLTTEGVPLGPNREAAHIRKTKWADLPPLEHVFVEGLYFTLTDVVLLPCIHHFLVSVRKKQKEKLADFPLILGWYRRVQEVPGVCRAAALCGMQFIHLYDSEYLKEEPQRPPITKQQETQDEEDSNFIGGPRPTMTKLMERGIKAIFSPHPSPSQTIDWGNLPAAVNPEEGKMSGHRALRKKQQIDNLVSAVTNLAKPGDVIVDFCSGGGHVGLVLAYLLPSCQVALHACGVATDMVIGRCVRARAAFVVCPCCYGFIQNTVKSTFPRSHRFREVLSYREHMILCRFADQTDAQLPPERRLIGKRCMGLVDLDRAWAAEGCGYSAQVISMEPECCSPKNNMIVGAPL